MKKVIYQPVEPFIINQKFGENSACVNDDLNVITCDGNNPPEGYRSLYGPEGHRGLDLRAYHGQPVFAARDGIVTYIDTNIRTGLDVRITSSIDGKQITHIYEHLLGYQHKVGDVVKTGQVIGWADNTGYSSGDHLHFEVRDENGNSIDPLSIMDDIPATEVLAVFNKLTFIKEQIALLAEKVADYLRKNK